VAGHGAWRASHDALDRTELRVQASARFADPKDLDEFVSLGNSVEITLKKGAWSVRIDGRRPAGFTLVAEGPIEEAFDEAEQTRAESAIEDQDCGRILGVSGNMDATLLVTLINRPKESGIHWIRTTVALQRALSERWLGTLNEIFADQEQQVVLVQDAGASFLEASGLYVRGPEAPSQAWGDSPWSSDVKRYAAAYLADGRIPAPPPPAIAPAQSRGLVELERLLQRLASDLSWYWLAARVSDDAGVLTLRFDGARVVDIGLPPLLLDYEEAPLALWQWGVANPDPDRRQAIQQAASLAISEETDILSAARPVLRTAQSLYQLARQGAVAEALATRRTAREAAIAAARNAADAARTAAGKALERSGLQLAALAGILIAQNKQTLDAGAAARLSSGVLLLLLVTFIVSVTLDFPGASSILTSFDRDLKQYREALAETDLEAVRGMDSLRRAKRQVYWSWGLTITVFLPVLAAVAYLTGWLIHWDVRMLLP